MRRIIACHFCTAILVPEKFARKSGVSMREHIVVPANVVFSCLLASSSTVNPRFGHHLAQRIDAIRTSHASPGGGPPDPTASCAWRLAHAPLGIGGRSATSVAQLSCGWRRSSPCRFGRSQSRRMPCHLGLRRLHLSSKIPCAVAPSGFGWLGPATKAWFWTAWLGNHDGSGGSSQRRRPCSNGRWTLQSGWQRVVPSWAS